MPRSHSSGTSSRAASGAVRILIVDDHLVVRQGLRNLLERRPGIAVVGEACDGEEALRKVRALSPDIVLLDIAMPKLNGIETARELRRNGSAARIIMLSMHDGSEYIMESFRAGARGYLLKSACHEDLFPAIEKVRAGGIYCDDNLAPNELERLRTGSRR